ncbi:serine hydrolase domain-containing protein [Peribacillus sp. SCS-155]|uniref:serine hydrolase domain-containing protein n=1 Tax=Peribacillus sedimenti TaxID=3115297 RepID=UPI003906278D
MRELRGRLKNYMDNMAANNHFTGSVLVGYKGEILLKEGYGKASFQYDIQNKAATKFRVGSITKAFTAMAILILHEEGKLDISKTIQNIFPEYPGGDRITIRHLLTHTAGIPNFTGSPEYWANQMRLPSTLGQLIQSFKDIPLDFQPGERMEYSNSGYLLLTSMIEKVSGMTYAEFLDRTILKKLNLKNTGVDNGRTIIKSLSTGHTVWKDVIHTEFIDMSFPLGAYGLYSTAEDLYRWTQALMNNEFLSDNLQNQMFTGSEHEYAYGWFKNGENHVSHFGDINGFASNIDLYLDKELAVIVLSNINITPVTQISGDLANMVLGRPVKEVNKTSPLNVMQSPGIFAGSYKSGNTEIQISLENDLYAIVPKMYGVPYKLKLVPVSEASGQVMFHGEFIRDQYIFQINSEGSVESLDFEDCHGRKASYVPKYVEAVSTQRGIEGF